MKKILGFFIGLAIIVGVGFGSYRWYQQIHNIQAGKTVEVNAWSYNNPDSGKTFTLTMSSMLQIKQYACGDCGSSSNAPQFDANVLSLQSHTYTSPPRYAPVGQSGYDTWTFKPTAVGQTTVTTSESRPWEHVAPLSDGTFYIVVTK